MEALVKGPLDVVRLTSLTEIARGRPEIAIGLIDGPVLLTHPGLAGQSIQEVPGKLRGTCARADSVACLHGTFVAGILCARRDSAAPAICPGCTLLVRPIYSETNAATGDRPSATLEELAEAVVDCVDAGARVLNLSSGLTKSSPRGSWRLGQALDYATSRGVIVVAAAGNRGWVGNSVITSHAGVIPVAPFRLEPRTLHRPTRLAGSGPRHHEPWGEWWTADIGRNKRCGAFRIGNNSIVVVGVSAYEYQPHEIGYSPGDTSPEADHCAPPAGCLDSIPSP
jgi:subtilisin family serine protease